VEERDDGVYIEMEAVALSRPVPGAMRFVVDPVVRRVSRNSMLTSLQQTEEAVRIKHAESPAGAEKMSSASAALKHKAAAFEGIE
jgi:hypothetical protein